MEEIITIPITINKTNNDYVQDLISKLTMLGAVHQNDARGFFIAAEAMKGKYYK